MISKGQIVTITFLKYRGFAAKYWAFTQMGLVRRQMQTPAGLQFYKLMGSGKKGFSIIPNFSTYCLLCVWENESAARSFQEKAPYFQQFKEKADQIYTLFMQTQTAHGQWDSINPFEMNTQIAENELIGVLTRASIKTRHLLRFWKQVPSVNRVVQNAAGLIFTIGVGELPIVQQATFSLWINSKAMKKYAYEDKHLEIVKRTRSEGWYSEELFARFKPYASEGVWDDLDLEF